MGGLIQLVAYGEQDIVLTGSPTVTFFQAVYKRHTNFAMETIQQTVNGNLAANGRLTLVVARNGDLVGETYIELLSNTVTLGSNIFSGYSTTTGVTDGTSWMAERAIIDVSLSIGGQQIDKHYQRWWRLYSELYLDEAKKIQYGKMTSNPNLALGTTSAVTSGVAPSGTVYLPLLFFFNRNPGMYLPLIALQYHEVRIDFDISQEFQAYFSRTVFKVWSNYVYLDTEERKMFAQKGHEYLIEQLQYTGAVALTATPGTTTNFTRITYNHPVKELVWCVTQNASGGKQLWDFTKNAATVNTTLISTSPIMSNTYFSNINAAGTFIGVAPSNTANTIGMLSNAYVVPNMMIPVSYCTGAPMQMFLSSQYPQYQWCEDNVTANTSYGPVLDFKLIINGQDRMKAQSGKYYNQVQSFNHHSSNPYPGIYSYSFALKPEQHQPSGTCNFSRVDNSQAAITLKSGVSAGSYLEMFAINYNVLRIQSGMGGLAFSN